jgi:cobalt-zinc-cadmium efflux system protein
MARPDQHDRQHDHRHAHDHAHGHADGHGHAAGRGHHHHPSPDAMGRAFAIGVALNSAIVLAQAAAGVWSHSLALLADAGHNLSDVLALVLAWGAAALARRAPTGRRTYGLRKGTILASLGNAVLLLVAVGAIGAESLHRFAAPAPVASGMVMLTAGLGALVNGATAALFFRGSHGDLNVRGAFLHMAGDAAVSVAVVVGAFVMSRTGLLWIDPALGLAIAAVIVLSAWGILRESFDLALDAAPKEIDVAEVRDWLAGQPGVVEVHDLHIWAISTTETALTAHVIRPANADADAFLHATGEALARRFNIGHATVQVETQTGNGCRLAPIEVV